MPPMMSCEPFASPSPCEHPAPQSGNPNANRILKGAFLYEPLMTSLLWEERLHLACHASRHEAATLLTLDRRSIVGVITDRCARRESGADRDQVALRK